MPRCTVQGYTVNNALFGLPNETQVFCANHKTDRAIDLNSKYATSPLLQDTTDSIIPDGHIPVDHALARLEASYMYEDLQEHAMIVTDWY
jgi:hypothetical protein